jgi:hypothetical protein
MHTNEELEERNMENKMKMVVGAALAGTGFIVSEINKRKKIKELDWKINSMNRSMGAFAEAHNSFVERMHDETDEVYNLISSVVEDNEKQDDVLEEMKEEICTVYDHIEELDRIKVNADGSSNQSIDEDDINVIMEVQKINVEDLIEKLTE